MKRVLLWGGVVAATVLAGGAWLLASPRPSPQVHNATGHSVDSPPKERTAHSTRAQTEPQPTTATARATIPPTTITIPTVGTPTIVPSVITANTPTPATVTVPIADSTLLSGSVNLLRLGVTGTQPTILGVMHDDGKNADAISGDHTYTVQITLNEAAQGEVRLAVSAAFRGFLTRSLSPAITITTRGLVFNSLVMLSDLIIIGTITAEHASSDSSSQTILTSYTVSVSHIIKGSSPATIVLQVPGGTVGNRTQQVQGYGSMRVGQQLLLLLSGPTASNSYFLPDGALDQFIITNSPLGQLAIVHPAYDDLDLAVPLDATYTDLLARSSNGRLLLTDLLTAVH